MGLEVGIGEDERGEEVEVDLDNLEVVDEDGAPKLDEEDNTIEITPCNEDSIDILDEQLNTPEMNQQTHDENENGMKMSPGAASVDAAENVKEEEDDDAEAGTKSQ